MRAMVLDKVKNIEEGEDPLELTDLPIPVPGDNEIQVKVATCGVCHTELDEIEGRTMPSKFPIVLGHEVVGHVVKKGPSLGLFDIGQRVGIGWIFSSCGKCEYCKGGNENLCSDFKATGRDADGGYAEYMVVPESSAYLIPDNFTDTEAAPLLCAGGVGFRSLKLTGLSDGQNPRPHRLRRLGAPGASAGKTQVPEFEVLCLHS